MSLAVALILVLLIAISPFSVSAAAFLWQVHRLDRAATPAPTVRLSLVMAITGSIGAICATYLAVAAVLTLIGRTDITRALTPFTLAVFVALDVVPLLNAGYLRRMRP